MNESTGGKLVENPNAPLPQNVIKHKPNARYEPRTMSRNIQYSAKSQGKHKGLNTQTNSKTRNTCEQSSD